MTAENCCTFLGGCLQSIQLPRVPESVWAWGGKKSQNQRRVSSPCVCGILLFCDKSILSHSSHAVWSEASLSSEAGCLIRNGQFHMLYSEIDVKMGM